MSVLDTIIKKQLDKLYNSQEGHNLMRPHVHFITVDVDCNQENATIDQNLHDNDSNLDIVQLLQQFNKKAKEKSKTKQQTCSKQLIEIAYQIMTNAESTIDNLSLVLQFLLAERQFGVIKGHIVKNRLILSEGLLFSLINIILQPSESSGIDIFIQTQTQQADLDWDEENISFLQKLLEKNNNNNNNNNNIGIVPFIFMIEIFKLPVNSELMQMHLKKLTIHQIDNLFDILLILCEVRCPSVPNLHLPTLKQLLFWFGLTFDSSFLHISLSKTTHPRLQQFSSFLDQLIDECEVLDALQNIQSVKENKIADQAEDVRYQIEKHHLGYSIELLHM